MGTGTSQISIENPRTKTHNFFKFSQIMSTDSVSDPTSADRYFGVSKTKKGVKLPDKTFTYGRPNHCIDGGAQEAMQYLVLQEKREIQKAQDRTKKVICESKDFVKLNRIAIKSGLVTSAEQQKAMEFLSRKSIKTRNSSQNKTLSDVRMNIFDMPPAGIQKIRNCQEEIDAGAAAAYKNQRQAEEREKQRKKKISETQAKLIRSINDKALLKEEQRSNPKQPWQMSKFKSVKSNLDTFRSMDLKRQSFKQHEDNRCIRLGQTG